MAKKITKKPTSGVKMNSITRSGTAVTAKWAVPSALTKDSKKRATHLYVKRTISGTSTIGDGAYKSTSTKEISLNYGSFKPSSTTYTRNSFYPITSRKVTGITVTVAPWNAKCPKGGVHPASLTYHFYAPRKPSITAPTTDASNGQISCTIATNAGDDNYERYNTWAQRTVKTVTYAAGSTRPTETVSTADITHSATSYTDTYDASDYQNLGYDDYIVYTVKAYARGMAGDSGQVSTTYYLSYPSQVTIGKIDVSSADGTGKVTVHIKTNQTTQHPVDKVVLETLADVEYSSASQIPAGAAWTASDSVDDGECTALAASVANLIPDAGHYTWVRVKSTHAVEGVLYRYSEAVRLKDLETPAATAADEEIVIIDAKSGDDGESAVVQLGWNADGTDDADGTELSWSSDAGIWRSTDEPDTHEFTWSDGSYTDASVTPSVTYQDSAEITIKGLDSGVPVYIKARRYKDGDTRTYSDYSDTKMTIPSAAPDGVVLIAPPYVPIGSPIGCEWTFGGGGVQRSWVLYCNGSPIAEGAGTTGHYEIAAETVAKRAEDGQLSLSVEVSTGGDPAISDAVTVTVRQPPTLTVAADATLTAQPMAFTATVSELCDLSAVLTCDGTSGQTAAGMESQLSGYVVWSDAVEPQWTASGDAYTATVTLPIRRTIQDGVRYTLTVTATSRDTQLQSAAAVAHIEVDWAHKAPFPEDYATITPQDYIDEDGVHHMAALIEIDATVGEGAAASTDVIDVYRVTADGASLIGEGYPLTYQAVDDYAPFGTEVDLEYRIAIRTVDGDTAFDDIEYELPADYMRLDWAGGYLELPYNIAISDAYSKDVDVRKHIGGSESAYYNAGVSRTGKLASVLIRADNTSDIEAARAIAGYAGAMFVRTPDGSAYEADVQISDMNTDGVLLNLTINTRRVAETAAYMLPPIEAEEEEGGE